MMQQGLIVGKYKLGRQIGEGSYGTVYQAEQIGSLRKVAVKILKEEFSADRQDYLKLRDSFMQEIYLQKMLKHPHILSIVDHGFYEDRPYIVTNYAPNGSLEQRLRFSTQPFPFDEAMTIITQVGQALFHAHEQHNIVHRDLKPDNILFDSRGNALVADFGVAIMLSSGKTENASSTGTPRYMAPEQFQGLASKKCDQYALGCIAYRLLTGRHPYRAIDWWHSNEQAQNPCDFNPQLPDPVGKAILKSIQYRKERRFETVFAFISALDSTKVKEQMLQQGQAAYRAGQYNEALAIYKRLLLFDPKYTLAYIARGEVFVSLSRPDQALLDYRQAIYYDSSNASAHFSIAIVHKRQGRYPEALAALEQTVQRDPHHADAYNHLGMVLSMLGRYEEAWDAYIQAGQYAGTVLQWSSKEIESYNRRGCALLYLKRYEEALQHYEQAAHFEAKNAPAHYGKGVALYYLERFDQALLSYQEAARFASNQLKGYVLLGEALVYLELRQPEEALQAIEQCNLLQPEQLETMLCQAFAFVQLDRLDPALKSFESVLHVQPDHIPALAGKAFLLKKLGRLSDALQTYQSLLLYQQNEIYIITNIVDLQKKLGYEQDMLANYELLAQLDAGNAKIWHELGHAAEKAQDYIRAFDAYNHAHLLQPEQISVQNACGRMLLHLKRYQDALTFFEQVIRLSPSNGDAYIGKGRALKMLSLHQ